MAIIIEGRGLSAMLAKSSVKRAPGSLSLSDIQPNPGQPRKFFDEEALEELAESIKVHGLLQPIIVTPSQDESGKYVIVAGERRWHACQKAGLAEAPVKVVEGDARTLGEIALVENLQREDLSPLEAANALKSLMDQHHMTQEELASRIGWNRSAVSNKLRILTLPDFVLTHIAAGKLTEGHAKVLLSLNDQNQLQELVDDCLRFGWSVRELTRRVNHLNTHLVLVAPPKLQRWRPARAKKVARELGISLGVSGNGDYNRVVMTGLSRDQVNRLCALLEREIPFMTEVENEG